MQSTRGLRWAIRSTSPRYTNLNHPCRSFTSLFKQRNIKQSSHTLDYKQPVALRKLRKIGEQKAHIHNGGPNAVAGDADGSTTARPESEASAASDREARDLCNSVTSTMAKLPHPVVVITTLDRTYHAQAAAGVPIEDMRHPIARGITVSSFTSLCIRPRPHVMFNMTLPSTMYEALIACKDFNVHVLTPDKSGARVASVFTRGNRLPPLPVGEPGRSKYAFDIDADLGVFVGLKDREFCHAEIANRDAWHEQYQDAKEAILQASAPPYETYPGVQDPEVAKPTKQLHHVPCLHSSGIIEVLHCRLVRTIHPELPNAGQNVVMIGEVVNITAPKQFDARTSRSPVALGYADRKYRSIGGDIRPYERDGPGGRS